MERYICNIFRPNGLPDGLIDDYISMLGAHLSRKHLHELRFWQLRQRRDATRAAYGSAMWKISAALGTQRVTLQLTGDRHEVFVANDDVRTKHTVRKELTDAIEQVFAECGLNARFNTHTFYDDVRKDPAFRYYEALSRTS